MVKSNYYFYLSFVPNRCCLLPTPRPPQIEVTYPDGSPADGVKVRVKAELTPKDNVYASELTSSNGKATFEIPSIPTSAQYVWLEVSVQLWVLHQNKRKRKDVLKCDLALNMLKICMYGMEYGYGVQLYKRE